MAIRRTGKGWFELSKVLIDDYAAAIGIDGIAVYVCLKRMCEREEDGYHFAFADLPTMLGLDEADIYRAVEKLIAAKVLRREMTTNSKGVEMTNYVLEDLLPQYYGLTPGECIGNADYAPPDPEPDTPRLSTSCKGFVYVVEGEGYFKIGCTKDIHQRVKALTVRAPFSLIVHAVIPSLDMYGTETELHRRFAKKHRRGEWFNLEAKDIADICRDYQTLEPAFLSTE